MSDGRGAVTHGPCLVSGARCTECTVHGVAIGGIDRLPNDGGGGRGRGGVMGWGGAGGGSLGRGDGRRGGGVRRVRDGASAFDASLFGKLTLISERFVKPRKPVTMS